MRRRRKSIKDIVFTIIKCLLISFIALFILVVAVQRITNNNFAVGGFRIFTVISQSMVPRYQIGDILIVKSVDVDTIKVGDDLCYLGKVEDFKDKVVTHEVKKIEKIDDKLVFTTEGIANVMPDPLVYEDQIYGKVVYKTVVFSFLSRLANTKYGFFILVFIPLLIFIALEVKDLLFEVGRRDRHRMR